MTKNYIFILLAIVIVTHRLQQSFLTQNDQEEMSLAAEVRQNYLLLANTRNCEYKTARFSFRLNHCKQYRIGSWLTLIGRETLPSDKRFFSPKRLTIHAVEQNSKSKGSVNAWLETSTRWIFQLRQRALEVIKKNIPEPHAGLVTGMVFGGTEQLPAALQDQLRIAGMTHVVSASGYNVSIVVGLGLSIIQNLSRKIKFLVAILLVWIYALMANLVPPVVRAAVMISLSLAGTQLFFRRYHPGYSLVLTTLGLIIYEPWFARNLSFWLSVGATAGIVWILPLLESSKGWLYQLGTGALPVPANPPQLEEKPTNPILAEIRDSGLTTLAAQVFTTPLTWLTFGQFSLVSLVSNSMLLWLTPLITLTGLGAMIVGVISMPLPQVHQFIMAVATPIIWLPAQLFLIGARWFGRWQWGVIGS